MESAVACCVKGRPREFDLDEALSAALRVFWRNGYDGASMAELTAEMGITKPSLYAAFGNKESLFKKALDLYEREKLAYMRTALEAATSRQVAERLLEGALALQTGGETRGCLGVISSVVVGAEAQSIRDEVIARRRSSIEALVARFTRAKQEGDLPASVKPESLARYLGAVLQGMAVQASAGATAEELRALVDITLGLWPGR